MLKIQVEIKSLTKTLLIRQSWQNLHTSISHKFTRSIYPMKNYLEFSNKLVLLRWNVHSLTSLERYIFISSLPSLHGNQGTQTLAGRRNWGNDSSDAITSPFSPLSSFSRESRPEHWHFHRFRRGSHEYSRVGDASCIEGGRVFLSMQYANIIHRHAPSVPFFPWRGPPGDPVRIIPHLTRSEIFLFTP